MAKKSGNTKNFYIMSIGMLLFIVILSVSLYSFMLRGEEQVMVPDVQGIDIVDAMEKLQEKELWPRIQLRQTQSSNDKGFVLEQKPKAGTFVKAGRQVDLVVSQGAMRLRIANYIGRKIDEVQKELLSTPDALGNILLTIKEPIIYDFSSETAGTILSQKPEAATEVFRPTRMEFVVSRGQELTQITVPQFTGLPLTEALDLISKTGILFNFSLQETTINEQGETVISQDPLAGTGISKDTAVNLVLSKPVKLKEDEVFKIFTYNVVKNPYPLPLKLEAEMPSGESKLLYAADFSGGKITIPYRLPVNSILILSMMNREIYRETAWL